MRACHCNTDGCRSRYGMGMVFLTNTQNESVVFTIVFAFLFLHEGFLLTIQ